MKQFVLTLALLVLIVSSVSAQIIDKYGVHIGGTYTNQIWDYKFFPDDKQIKDYKPGCYLFLFAEKKVNELFSIRTEIGYIQKGFENNMNLILLDGSSAGNTDGRVIYHDLGFNLGLKISPFSNYLNPYVLLGLGARYLLSYEDVIFEEFGSGSIFNIYSDQIEEFNTFNMDALIGVGIELNELIAVELEYDPTLIARFNDASLNVKDNAWVFKLGINLSELIRNKRNQEYCP
jgi:opacity protein-like surface antigen